jgi:hypothetical protein
MTTLKLKRPNHTTVYNLGIKKNLSINPLKKIYGQLLFELNYMEKTPEYIQPYSFYAHNLIIHGYTNNGQWLGNAVSPIGNAQSVKFTLYYPNGNSSLMFSRNNSNNHYIYDKEIETGYTIYPTIYWANINFDILTVYYFTKYLQCIGGLSYNIIVNQNYKNFYNDNYTNNTNDILKHNFSFQLGIKLIL